MFDIATYLLTEVRQNVKMFSSLNMLTIQESTKGTIENNFSTLQFDGKQRWMLRNDSSRECYN